jgi:hypothetical protein
VEDSPGFEVGDDLLDNPSDLVDLGIEFLSQSKRSRWSGFLMGVIMLLPT